MNGVMSASVSPGSSQRDTSVTWTPIVRVPSGAAGAGTAGATSATAMMARTSRRRARISKTSCRDGCRAAAFASVRERLPYRPAAHLRLRQRRYSPLDDDRRKRMTKWIRTLALGVALLVGTGPVGEAAAQAKPEGEMRWALYVTLAPVWFDPGES